MPSLVDYKGLQVVSPDPTGDGGLAIQNDFKSLVDWNPRSVWAQTADPTVNDDEDDDFHPGSMWLRTNVTPPKLFVCQSSTVAAAVWSQVALAAGVATSTKTSAYTLSTADGVIFADATSGAFTVTLPTAIGIAGRQYTVKRINGGSNNVTVATTASQTIDGASTHVLSTQYQKVTVASDGANWFVI